MRTTVGLIAAIFVCLTSTANAQDHQSGSDGTPRVFLLDAERLAVTRKRIASGDERFRPALDELEDDAHQALDEGPFTVTSKSILPPSGDKHDYISQGPYWWPNPDTPDGLPYIRRDGETNPEIRKHTDKSHMGRMTTAVETLALAWYFTGDEKYAGHAVRLLRAWFLDPETRMNPNLNFGQGIPGICEGRGIGIIETRGLPRVADAAGLLAGSKAWTADDHQRLQQWFDDYLSWLLESEYGRDEAATRNNHATYYDVQVASFALFVGKTDLARKVLSDARQKRVADQIEPDGRQPRELARTRPWGYSTMNLQGFLQLAVLGEHVGVDLWNYRTDDGRGIRQAVDWLVPFATGDEKWPHRDLRGHDPEALYPAIRLAATRYRDERFARAAAKIPAPRPDSRERLLLGL